MKNLTFIPIALMLSWPAQAQESVVITFADGTTQAMSFDEIPEITGVTTEQLRPDPVIAERVVPSVTVTTDDTGFFADITLAPVYSQGRDIGVVGEDKTVTVYGDAPKTGVTVRITEPAPVTCCQPAPPPPPPAIAEMSFPGMNFETNKCAITPDGMKRVDLVARIMVANPELRIRITGHTDAIGSDHANLLLSQIRARSFRQALIDRHGIAPNRIETNGMGERQPIQSNDTKEGRYANRRIVITPIRYPKIGCGSRKEPSKNHASFVSNACMVHLYHSFPVDLQTRVLGGLSRCLPAAPSLFRSEYRACAIHGHTQKVEALAFQDQDVVVSTLGGRRPTKAATAIYVRSAEAIVQAAQGTDLKRVLVTSSALLFPAMTHLDKLLRAIVPNVVRSAGRMEAVLANAQLPWISARCGFLNDEPSYAYRAEFGRLPENGTAVSRAALATFLLDTAVKADAPTGVFGVSRADS